VFQKPKLDCPDSLASPSMCEVQNFPWQVSRLKLTKAKAQSVSYLLQTIDFSRNDMH